MIPHHALPEPVDDKLRAEQVPDGHLLRLGIAEPVTYRAYELGRRRWGWLRDPRGLRLDAGVSADPAIRGRSGPLHWSVALEQRPDGSWEVTGADSFESEAHAQVFAVRRFGDAAMAEEIRARQGG